MTPDPFRPLLFRMWMVAMWFQIFFLSLSGTPHFIHDSGASSIRCSVNSRRGVAVLFLRLNHYECHPLLVVDSRIDGYSLTQLF